MLEKNFGSALAPLGRLSLSWFGAPFFPTDEEQISSLNNPDAGPGVGCSQFENSSYRNVKRIGQSEESKQQKPANPPNPPLPKGGGGIFIVRG